MTAEQMEFWFAENKLFDNLTVGDYNRKEGMKLKSRLFSIMKTTFEQWFGQNGNIILEKTEPFPWLRRVA